MNFRVLSAIILGFFVGTAGTLWVIDSSKPHTTTANIPKFVNLIHKEPDSTLQTLTLSFQQQREFDNEIALRLALAKATDVEVLKLIALVRDAQLVESPESHANLLGVLIQRVAITNPRKAVNITRTLDPKYRSVCFRLVFLEWGSSDLDSAIEVAKTLSDSTLESAILGIMNSRWDLSCADYYNIAKELNVQTVAVEQMLKSRDLIQSAIPESAWDMVLSSIESGQLINWLPELRTLALRWVEEEWLGVLPYMVTSLGSLELQQAVLYRIIAVSSREDLNSLFAYTLPWNDVFYEELRHRIVAGWAHSDPLNALDTVNAMKFSRHKLGLLKTIADFWDLDSEYSLKDHLDKFPPSIRDWANYRVVENPSVFDIPFYDNWYDD